MKNLQHPGKLSKCSSDSEKYNKCSLKSYLGNPKLYFMELLQIPPPALIPPELWLTLGSAETHVAGQAVLPATQKGWAARQPPLSPHSRFIPKASALLMRAMCSTVTSRLCQQISTHMLHISTLPIDHWSNVMKFTYTWYQAHTQVKHTPFSPRPPSEWSKHSCQNSATSSAAEVRQAGWVEKGSTHTSAQRYVMDNIWNDSPGPRCRPRTHLAGASLPTNQSRSAARGPAPPCVPHICCWAVCNPHTCSELQMLLRKPSAIKGKRCIWENLYGCFFNYGHFRPCGLKETYLKHFY